MENRSMEAAVHTADYRTKHLGTALTALVSLRRCLEAEVGSELPIGYKALQRTLDNRSIYDDDDDEQPEVTAFCRLTKLSGMLLHLDTVHRFILGQDLD
jgi:hypothetical protein